MKNAKWKIILCVAAGLSACTPKMTEVRYSRQLIDARMSAWYNKDKQVGFPNANSTNGITFPAAEATWDYVPGVVAKGILDVWQYYQDSTWADAWFIGLRDWALNVNSGVFNPGILDDFNCAKVYIELYNGTKPGGRFENADHAAFFMNQMRLCARGLEEHKTRYSLPNGGWMHKAKDDPRESYWGQMWCDGAYMGPALLAQLLAIGVCEETNLGWNDVYDQFYASWPYLWDSEKRLPYHVLFTDVTTNKNGRALYEAGHLYECKVEGVKCKVYHSEEYWGRAAGWYILALVDVLEAYMQSLEASGERLAGDPLPSAANFEILHEYLIELADGLVARQDPETGCWYQLLQYDNTQCATQGIDDTGSPKYTNVSEGGTQCNYLESSASCLITAALLKGSRLGLLNHTEAGKKGFEGIIKQFVRGEQGDYTITSSCQSAGLSKDRNGSAAYYLIGKDVGIQDNTEGKVLGAFLMAAVEYERLMDF